MSYIFDHLNKEVAGLALTIVEPSIKAVLGSSVVGNDRCNLHVVILHPNTGKIVLEKSYGNREEWKTPYDEIARSKAAASYQTGMTTRKIGNDFPWLFDFGSTHYAGGIVEARLAVAASGLQDHFDEMFAWMIFNAIQGLCRHHMYSIRAAEPRQHFLT